MIRHLYVHVPFCARICPYCAFYKDLLDRSQTSRFCEAILRDLDRRRTHFAISPETLYFGGGPPTARSLVSSGVDHRSESGERVSAQGSAASQAGSNSNQSWRSVLGRRVTEAVRPRTQREPGRAIVSSSARSRVLERQHRSDVRFARPDH